MSIISEKITKSIYNLYLNKNTENDTEFDFFNYWINYSGFRIQSVEGVEEILDFIRLVLKSDKEYLKDFINAEN
jgi:hypothetical protein